MPQSMFTELEMLDFTGKDIMIFTTHEGSGLANVPKDIKKICKGANILDTIAITGSTVHFAKDKIEKWING